MYSIEVFFFYHKRNNKIMVEYFRILQFYYKLVAKIRVALHIVASE